MYSGAAGIDVLNNALQEVFNPSDGMKKELRIGYTTFREGDKILQLKNQPDDEVFNGDIGTLAEIIEARESPDRKTTIIVDFQGIFVEYNQDSWNNISLAYCISVHKSQGSEYPIVVMPVMMTHFIMLQRNLIYTGITRAKKLLVLVGTKKAIAYAVKHITVTKRNTKLKDRLQKI
jgi:exodeoxyribonuclease V alpha subunit